jgi:nucleotide-binding universal stress UspA family protein
VTIARWYRSRITALHVYSPAFVPIPAMPDPSARLPQSESTRLTAETSALFESARAAGIAVDIVIDAGRPAPTVVEQARALNASLIVMGTHGASGFEHLLLGSVTEKVLRTASCPVLTVPPRVHATSKLPFERLLCPVDFSPASLAALDLAFSFTDEARAALTVLNVIEWPWEEPPAPNLADMPSEQAAALAEFRRSREKEAEARLESVVPASRRGTPQGPLLRFTHGKAYAEILRAANEMSVDLIVMGVHGRSAVDLAVFGSAANHVVRQARCPVLTLRR